MVCAANLEIDIMFSARMTCQKMSTDVSWLRTWADFRLWTGPEVDIEHAKFLCQLVPHIGLIKALSPGTTLDTHLDCMLNIGRFQIMAAHLLVIM